MDSWLQGDAYDLQEELEKARGDAAKQKAKKKVERIKEQLKRLKIQRTDKVGISSSVYWFVPSAELTSIFACFFTSDLAVGVLHLNVGHPSSVPPIVVFRHRTTFS